LFGFSPKYRNDYITEVMAILTQKMKSSPPRFLRPAGKLPEQTDEPSTEAGHKGLAAAWRKSGCGMEFASAGKSGISKAGYKILPQTSMKSLVQCHRTD